MFGSIPFKIGGVSPASYYDASLRVMIRDGVAKETVLPGMMDEVKRTTGVKKDYRIADFFDLSFVQRASERIKASGWRP